MNENLLKIYDAIFQNAFEKLKASAVLYSNELYDSSYFLAIIAEEEVSKIVIVNFASELNKLNELEFKSSYYYHHTAKQIIALSYNTLARPEKSLEQLKQSSLYVGIGKELMPLLPDINKEMCYEEIKYAVDVVIDFAFTKISSKLLSQSTKNTIESFREFIDIYCPNLRKQIKEKHIKDTDKNPSARLMKIIYSKPDSLINILKLKYGVNNYKSYLEKIKKMPLDEIIEYIGE